MTTPAAPYRTFPNSFRQRLLAGETLIGCWCSLANPITTEVLGVAGFDWLLLDGEHSPNDVTTFIPQLMALKDSASAPVVRPASNNAVEIKRLLDAGFYNFLVPMVADRRRGAPRRRRDALSAARASAASRSRSAATASAPSPTTSPASTSRSACWCRSRAGRASQAAAEIAAVDGVDGVFVGPSDLAGGARPPRQRRTIRRCRRRSPRSSTAVKAVGKPIGILAPVEADARRYLAMGATLRRRRQRPRRLSQRHAGAARPLRARRPEPASSSSSSFDLSNTSRRRRGPPAAGSAAFEQVAALGEGADLGVGDRALQHPEAAVGMDVADPAGAEQLSRRARSRAPPRRPTRPRSP